MNNDEARRLDIAAYLIGYLQALLPEIPKAHHANIQQKLDEWDATFMGGQDGQRRTCA